jgi:hypothetical protein
MLCFAMVSVMNTGLFIRQMSGFCNMWSLVCVCVCVCVFLQSPKDTCSVHLLNANSTFVVLLHVELLNQIFLGQFNVL